MVLGIKYLRTLGPILWDFDDLRMVLCHQGRRILWKGIGSPQSDIPPTGRLHPIKGCEHVLLNRLLNSFEDVFSTPSGLPPRLVCDHRIHLLPSTAPVAVRPYSYPHLHNDELENQCVVMIEQGVVRPSTSLFSAPVLVKKPDDSWRFCVDYRAMNKHTVKDKFPNSYC